MVVEAAAAVGNESRDGDRVGFCSLVVGSRLRILLDISHIAASMAIRNHLSSFV